MSDMRCDACGYKLPSRLLVEVVSRLGKAVWLCELCLNTHTGTIAVRSIYSDYANVLRCLCYIGNAILDAIRERNRASHS